MIKEIQKNGFTLIEIIVVVVILAIAAAMAVPMFSGGAQIQAQSAASMVAASLEYAKSMAISHQMQYGVVFYTGTDSYNVVDQNNATVSHPVDVGSRYIVNFHSTGSSISNVDLKTANFDSTSKITFDYLGSPYNGSGGSLNSGTITVQGGGTTKTITVSPVTGYIQIQ